MTKIYGYKSLTKIYGYIVNDKNILLYGQWEKYIYIIPDDKEL